MPAEPYFAPADDGRERFCIFHPPKAQPPRALVLHIHAFAEEMNKSRRMAALQARALAAEAGCAVLQFDLLGCGDSAGDFGDATWARWRADVQWAAGELRRRAGADAPLWLWGQRVGALLASDCTAALSAAGQLLWQPVHQGKTALQQFLRLKAAAQLLDGGGKGITESLKRELAQGQTVEVAGYRLHPQLASGLDSARLQPPIGLRTVWLELANGEPPELLPASRSTIERWRAEGCPVDATALPGPAFWQTTEIEDAPALITASVEALRA
jgi:uncharacterized protein